MSNPSREQDKHAKETGRDFVVKLHNEGKRKEEIVEHYARECHGRQSPTEADKRFVDEALTNLEG